jgi:hypothetical protein
MTFSFKEVNLPKSGKVLNPENFLCAPLRFLAYFAAKELLKPINRKER